MNQIRHILNVSFPGSAIVHCCFININIGIIKCLYDDILFVVSIESNWTIEIGPTYFLSRHNRSHGFHDWTWKLTPLSHCFKRAICIATVSITITHHISMSPILEVKWNGKQFPIEFRNEKELERSTVKDVKSICQRITGVDPKYIKLYAFGGNKIL